jgi:hypothetical protein
VAEFKVLSRYLPGRTDENHYNEIEGLTDYSPQTDERRDEVARGL